MDLLHAFTHADEAGFEKISIPYIDYLDQRIVISDKTKSDLINQYEQLDISKSLNERIHVIRNRINLTCSQLPPKSFDKIDIAYIGRNSPEKRVHIMGKIASKLAATNNRVRINFVGEHLENGVNPEDVGNCIFYGPIYDTHQMEQLYSKFHCIIMTSSREGIPVIIMEGMAFGCVPITTNVGGISEIVQHQTTGILVDNDLDINKMVDEFCSQIDLLFENQNQYKRLSKNCFNYAQKAFSSKTFNSEYNKLLTPQ
ncbi:glycosyltransferase family 4 protein [Bacteroidota bacterium]